MLDRTFSMIFVLLALTFGLVACQAHTPDAADEPSSQPATQAANVLPNDGTRVVGDVTACPVSGEVFTVAADSPKAEFEGKTYYMCCGGCVGKFNADPARYLGKAAAEPKESPDASLALPNDGTRVAGDVTTCLVTGNVFTVAADSPKVEHEGKTYYMCCNPCVEKFKADPAKYLTANVPAE